MPSAYMTGLNVSLLMAAGLALGVLSSVDVGIVRGVLVTIITVLVPASGTTTFARDIEERTFARTNQENNASSLLSLLVSAVRKLIAVVLALAASPMAKALPPSASLTAFSAAATALSSSSRAVLISPFALMRSSSEPVRAVIAAAKALLTAARAAVIAADSISPPPFSSPPFSSPPFSLPPLLPVPLPPLDVPVELLLEHAPSRNAALQARQANSFRFIAVSPYMPSAQIPC